MNESPILFKAPLVRAILAGRKTQTRRLVKPQPEPIPADVPRVRGDDGFWWSASLAKSMVQTREMPSFCPYGTRGERLWVKETWRPTCVSGAGVHVVDYAADGEKRTFHPEQIGDDWTMPKAAARGNVSPLFMPRWASRITLEVTSVRVERLNEISEEDAIAEGLEKSDVIQAWRWDAGTTFGGAESPRDAFRALWNAINGTRCPWSSNPWIWAITFRRLP